MSKDNERLNLKEPDQIQRALNRGLLAIVGNGRLLGLFIGGVAILALAWLGFSTYTKNQDEALRSSYTEIEAQYDKELKDHSDKLDLLEKDLDTLKLKEKSLGDKSDMKLKTQISALEANMAELEPDHTESKKKFLAFYEANKNVPSGMLAAVRYAALALEVGETEKAKATLETVQTLSKEYSIIKITSGLMLTRIYEDAGQYDQGLVVVSELLNSAEKALKPRLLLTKARLELFSGNKDKAKDSIDALVKDFPSSQEVEVATSMKALLY